jgi:hypothetical protein
MLKSKTFLLECRDNMMKWYLFVVMMVVSSVQSVYGMEAKASQPTKSEDQILDALNCVLDFTGGRGDSVANVAALLDGVPEDRITQSRYYDIDREARCMKRVCCTICYDHMYTLNLLQWIFYEWFFCYKKDGFRILHDGHDMVAMLLKYRFDLNELFCYPQYWGWSRISVLHAAVMLDDDKLVEMIVAKRPQVNVKDSEGYTPIQRLVMRNNALHRNGELMPENQGVHQRHQIIATKLIEAGATFENCTVGRWCFKKPLQIIDATLKDKLTGKKRV